MAEVATRGRVGTMKFATRPCWAMRPFASSLPPGSPHVGLSFDDGPQPDYTPGVLERLAEHRVRAAFYLVGRNVERDPATAKRIAQAGHTLGNHSYAHVTGNPFDVRASFADIAACQKAIAGATGVRPTCYRPPFGTHTPARLIAARRHGLRTVTWSLDANDWQCRSLDDAVLCADALLREARPGDLILLHDGHAWVGPVLDRLLPGLRGRGLLPPSA